MRTVLLLTRFLLPVLVIGLGTGCPWIDDEMARERLDPDKDGIAWPRDCDDDDENVGRGPIWYADADGDGHGDPTTATQACAAPVGFVASQDDCDDTDATRVFPTRWVEDSDGDGFGAGRAILGCGPPDPRGWLAEGGETDCDDDDDAVHPDATEICNSRDDDCRGGIDDGLGLPCTCAKTPIPDCDAHPDCRLGRAHPLASATGVPDAVPAPLMVCAGREKPAAPIDLHHVAPFTEYRLVIDPIEIQTAVDTLALDPNDTNGWSAHGTLAVSTPNFNLYALAFAYPSLPAQTSCTGYVAPGTASAASFAEDLALSLDTGAPEVHVDPSSFTFAWAFSNKDIVLMNCDMAVVNTTLDFFRVELPGLLTNQAKTEVEDVALAVLGDLGAQLLTPWPFANDLACLPAADCPITLSWVQPDDAPTECWAADTDCAQPGFSTPCDRPGVAPEAFGACQ